MLPSLSAARTRVAAGVGGRAGVAAKSALWRAKRSASSGGGWQKQHEESWHQEGRGGSPFLAGVLTSSAAFAYYAAQQKRNFEEGKESSLHWDWQWDALWRPRWHRLASREGKTKIVDEKFAGSAKSVSTAESSSGKSPVEETSAAAKSGGGLAARQWWKREPLATRQLILVRHGQYENVHLSDDNKQGLTPLGKEQAHMTGQRLAELLAGKNCVALRHSTMKRARETAEIIAKYIPHVEMHPDSDLAEGTPQFPSPAGTSYTFTESEVTRDGARIEKAFQKNFYRANPAAKARSKAAEKGRTGTKDAKKKGNADYEVIVCHGNVIRYFFCRALQFPDTGWLRLSTYNCGLTWLGIDHTGRVSAREFGSVGHIPIEKITYH